MRITLKTNPGCVSIGVPSDIFFNIVEKKFTVFLELFDRHDEVTFEPFNKQDGEALILAYCKCMELNVAIPESLKDYFYKSFNQFLNGDRIEKSLGLVNPAKRPKSDKKPDRDLSIYYDVIQRMKKGIPLHEAALELSEKYHLHESNIQKIYSIVKKIEDIEIPF